MHKGHSVIVNHPPTCFVCSRSCEELYEQAEVDSYFGEAGHTKAEYARQDGTYNSITGHLMCDLCYVLDGCPTAPGGFKAP